MIRNIASLTLVVLLAVAAIGGYVYLLQGINASIAVIATTDGDTASAGKRAAFADSMRAFLTDVADQRTELESFVITEESVAPVIEAIESEARRDKVFVTVSSVTKGTELGWKNHGTVRLNLTGEGTYSALSTFAAALEALPLGSHLANMSLQAVGEKSDKRWYGEFSVIIVARLSPSP